MKRHEWIFGGQRIGMVCMGCGEHYNGAGSSSFCHSLYCVSTAPASPKADPLLFGAAMVGSDPVPAKAKADRPAITEEMILEGVRATLGINDTDLAEHMRDSYPKGYKVRADRVRAILTAALGAYQPKAETLLWEGDCHAGGYHPLLQYSEKLIGKRIRIVEVGP